MRSSTRFSHSLRRSLVAPLALAVLALGACTSTAASPGTASPTVSGAWVRPPAGMDAPAAAYFTITGGSVADALLSVATTIASTAEIHETSMDSSGMTGMHPITRLEVPPGATVKLEPGGYHVMLMGVTAAPKVGDTVELKLTFEKAGVITVRAEVRQS